MHNQDIKIDGGNTLKKILDTILAMGTAKEVEDILTEPLIKKLDHLTFGFECDAPEYFERFISVYHQFRKSFGVSKKPLKWREN